MTARSPLPRACGGCGFGEGTFAGVSGNDEDAPFRTLLGSESGFWLSMIDDRGF